MPGFFISAHCQTINDEKMSTLEEMFGKAPEMIVVEILGQPVVERFLTKDVTKTIPLESGRQEKDRTSFLRGAAMRAFVIEALLNPDDKEPRKLASQIRNLAADLGIDKTLATEAAEAALRGVTGAREQYLSRMH